MGLARPAPGWALDMIHALEAERDTLRAWVERTARSPELRTRKAGYHARRVCLEAGALLAEVDGLYHRAPTAASEPERTTP